MHVLKLMVVVVQLQVVLLTEWVKETLDEATEIKNTDIAEELAYHLLKYIVVY